MIIAWTPKRFFWIILMIVAFTGANTSIQVATENDGENERNSNQFASEVLNKLVSIEKMGRENSLTSQRLSEQFLRLFDTIEELRIKQNKMEHTLNKNTVSLRILLEPSKFGEKLHSAIKDGDIEQVVLLLKLGAPIEYQNSKKDRPIHSAVEYRQPQILEVLLENKADIEAHGQYSRSPLHWAGYSKCLECARILLDKGASVSSRDQWLNTPLMAPVVGGFNELVELLLQKGAVVNAVQVQKYNGMHFACREGHLDTLKILVKYGAELQAKTTYGETGLALARINHRVEVVNFLEDELRRRGV